MPAKDLTRWLEVEDGVFTRISSLSSEEGVKATKGAVDAAEELGVDLGSVVGTGRDGQVTKADVEAAASE